MIKQDTPRKVVRLSYNLRIGRQFAERLPVAPREYIGLISMIPYQSNDTAGSKDAMKLRKCYVGVEPVKCLASDDQINRAVGESRHLRRAVGIGGPPQCVAGCLASLFTHLRVRLDADHIPATQRKSAGQNTSSAPDVGDASIGNQVAENEPQGRIGISRSVAAVYFGESTESLDRVVIRSVEHRRVVSLL